VNWSKTPADIDECERCSMRNRHSQLYKCYGCDIIYCLFCIADDPVFVFEYFDFVAIFCEIECKRLYMRRHHPHLKDCEECHMMWPTDHYKDKECRKCVNGVCKKCKAKIDDGDLTHLHLDWEDRT
jgi:hypothetical protein